MGISGYTLAKQGEIQYLFLNAGNKSSLDLVFKHSKNSNLSFQKSLYSELKKLNKDTIIPDLLNTYSAVLNKFGFTIKNSLGINIFHLPASEDIKNLQLNENLILVVSHEMPVSDMTIEEFIAKNREYIWVAKIKVTHKNISEEVIPIKLLAANDSNELIGPDTCYLIDQNILIYAKNILESIGTEETEEPSYTQDICELYRFISGSVTNSILPKLETFILSEKEVLGDQLRAAHETWLSIPIEFGANFVFEEIKSKIIPKSAPESPFSREYDQLIYFIYFNLLALFNAWLDIDPDKSSIDYRLNAYKKYLETVGTDECGISAPVHSLAIHILFNKSGNNLYIRAEKVLKFKNLKKSFSRKEILNAAFDIFLMTFVINDNKIDRSPEFISSRSRIVTADKGLINFWSESSVLEAAGDDTLQSIMVINFNKIISLKLSKDEHRRLNDIFISSQNKLKSRFARNIAWDPGHLRESSYDLQEKIEERLL